MFLLNNFFFVNEKLCKVEDGERRRKRERKIKSVSGGLSNIIINDLDDDDDDGEIA